MDRSMGFRVRRFDCNPEQRIRISTSLQKNSTLSHSATAIVRKNDSLMHYGVSGMHWGEITKEYQPVAVDHRKTRGFVASRVAKYRQQVARDDAEVARINAERRRKTEKHRETMKKAGWIGAAAIGLFVTYKALRYTHIKKARAYTGILSNFIKNNPGALDTRSEEGRRLLKRGLDLAKANSRKLGKAEETARYLKRNGLAVSKKEALYGYKFRRLFNRYTSIKPGSNRVAKSINNYRRQRVAQKILNKRLRLTYGRR